MINTIAGKYFHIAAYDSIRGNLIADVTGEQLEECSFSYNEHGDLALDISCSISFEEALPYLLPRSILIWQVNDGPTPIWIGRGTIPQWEDGKLKINALGLWHSLDDIKYTALWSDTLYTEWKPMTPLQMTNRTNDYYEMSNDYKIFLGLTRGTTYGNGTNVGSMYYEVPSRSRTAMQTVSFDFNNTLLPTGWQAAVNYYTTSPFGGATQAWTHNSLGASVALTNQSVLVPAGVTLEFYAYNNSGINYTNTSENSVRSAQWTNVRIKSTTAATVTTQAVATHILQSNRAVNPGLLSARVDKIGGSTAYDHKQLILEDATPTQVLTDLAAKAATGTPLAPLNVGVWQGMLVVQNRYAGAKTWYHDLLNVRVQRDAVETYTEVYATYQDATGRTLRTAPVNDARTIVKAGFTKQDVINADTTDATQANNQRDLRLADRRRGNVKFDIPATSVIYDANGSPVPITEVRPGDILVAQQFQSFDTGDPLRSIRLGKITIDAVRGLLMMEAEEAIPTLETTLAAQG